MDNILKASLLASWIIFITMLIPVLNFMNASFGFWVWIAVGFSVYHYLNSVKKPEKNFGLKIGLKTAIISYIIILILIVALSLIFVTNFWTRSIAEIQQMSFFLPKIYDLGSLLSVMVMGALFIFIPSILTGYAIQLIYFNKNKVKPLKSYLIPLLFTAVAYSAVSAIIGVQFFSFAYDVILLIVAFSLFSSYALKYYNYISKKPVRTISQVFKFSFVFNLLAIITMMFLNRIFGFFNVPRPLEPSYTITAIPLVNEIAGFIFVSIIIGYWIILVGAVSYYMSKKIRKSQK